MCIRDSCGTLAALRKQAALDGSLEDVFLQLTEAPTLPSPASGGGSAAVSGEGKSPSGEGKAPVAGAGK